MRFFVLKRQTLINVAICLIVCAFTICGFAFSYGGVLNTNAPIYNGGKETNSVGLMFNCYEGADQIKEILKTLKDNDAKATFFIGGVWADKNVDILKHIKEDGHEIGNHGYLHKDHKKLNEIQNKQEIMSTHELVKKVLDIEMNLFAPPSGSYNKTTVKVAEELGYKTIMWSRDTIDWRDNDENLLFTRATKNIGGGEMILMHPKQQTSNVLPRIIKTILDKGLELKSISQIIK